MSSESYYEYQRIRSELIECYRIMTRRYFTVIAPRTVFMTMEEIEYLESKPPICGLDTFTRIVDIPITIEKIVRAYDIGGDEFQLSFRNPRRDIPIIYETIQNSIRLWMDIKLNVYNYRSAPMSELRAMERVAKCLFFAYKHYYREAVRKELTLNKRKKDIEMDDIFFNILKYGQEGPEDISFISYIDMYEDKIDVRKREMALILSDKQRGIEGNGETKKLLRIPKPKTTIVNWKK